MTDAAGNEAALPGHRDQDPVIDDRGERIPVRPVRFEHGFGLRS